MYGLIPENFGEYLRNKYGDEAWEKIAKKAGINHATFGISKKYSETVVPRLLKAASEILDEEADVLMEATGARFPTFVGLYGYDRILKVLARNLSEFLATVDNLHEYLKFSFPKLKPPSFFCENEAADGMVLHYRSKRKGFAKYVQGQIQTIAKVFYGKSMEIELLDKEESSDLTHVTYRLYFENEHFLHKQKEDADMDKRKREAALPIDSDMFFNVFPFHIVFNKSMQVRSVGTGLEAIMAGLINQPIDEMFMITRPLIEFNIENVQSHINAQFELLSVDPIKKTHGSTTGSTTHDSSASGSEEEEDVDPDDQTKKLRLKGQMIFQEEWDAIIFMGTPMMENLERMFKVGLFINDLSMHDSSRDLVLAGQQQQAELKMALAQEKEKNKRMETVMKKLDAEMSRTDELLYQMIPKSVADRLRQGESAMNTCQVFQKISFLFTDVVGFTNICSGLQPIQVVDMLNDMYTRFDKLTEKHKVFKVETIGDAYMVVSGAPIVSKFHAVYVADMAFDVVTTMTRIVDPSRKGEHLKVRIGCHTGNAVAGVVGVKMPRYCLFGDSVYTANAMESTGEAMRIHTSEPFKEEFAEQPLYIFEKRGEVDVKGKSMTTYWLLEKKQEEKKTKRF